MLYLTENGASAKIALVGRDGMVGLASTLGAGRSINRAMVQVSSFAYRAPAKAVNRLMAVESTRNIAEPFACWIAMQCRRACASVMRSSSGRCGDCCHTRGVDSARKPEAALPDRSCTTLPLDDRVVRRQTSRSGSAACRDT